MATVAPLIGWTLVRLIIAAVVWFWVAPLSQTSVPHAGEGEGWLLLPLDSVGRGLPGFVRPGLGVLIAILLGMLMAWPQRKRGVEAGALGVAFLLCILAVRGGSMSPLVQREPMGVSMPRLMLEDVTWILAWSGVIALAAWVRRVSRRHAKPGVLLAGDSTAVSQATGRVMLGPAWLDALAVVTTASIGGAIAHFLLPNGEASQALGALVVAFVVGALVTGMVMPRAGVAALLLAPMLVGLVMHGLGIVHFKQPDDLRAAWNVHDGLVRLAGVLPLHFAAAGVLGAAVGLRISDALESARMMTH